jgi:hypothetical protein
MRRSTVLALSLASAALATGWAYVYSGRLRLIGGAVPAELPEWLLWPAAVIGLAAAGAFGILTSRADRPRRRLLRGVMWSATFAALVPAGPAVRYAGLCSHARALPLPADATELSWSADVVRFDRRPDYDFVVRCAGGGQTIYYDCWTAFKTAGWVYDQRSVWRDPDGRRWGGWIMIRGDEAVAVHFWSSDEWSGHTDIHVYRLDLPLPGVPRPDTPTR